MREAREIMADLVATGLSPEQIALMAELAMAAASEAVKPAAETAEERKKRISRETSRRHRASRNVTNASPSVTEDIVTECHQMSPGDTGASPPRARVEDNPLRVIPLEAAAAADVSAGAWPEGSAGEWAEALVNLAASHRLSPAKQPGLALTLGELVRWKTAGASWEFDVVPVVTTMARKQGPPVASWKYFSPAIAQSVADNRKALEIPEARQNERPDTPSAKRTAREDNLSRGFRIGLAVAGS